MINAWITLSQGSPFRSNQQYQSWLRLVCTSWYQHIVCWYTGMCRFCGNEQLIAEKYLKNIKPFNPILMQIEFNFNKRRVQMSHKWPAIVILG